MDRFEAGVKAYERVIKAFFELEEAEENDDTEGAEVALMQLGFASDEERMLIGNEGEEVRSAVHSIASWRLLGLINEQPLLGGEDV
jgi:hypothetical protein